MELLADRFAVLDRHGHEHLAVDVATGERVTIQTMAAGGSSEQIEWAGRCDRFFRLHHKAIARLVDYGPLGATLRFEAWRCGARWCGGVRVGSRALDHAREFLRAIGVSPGPLDRDDLRMHAGEPVVLPTSTAGYELPSSNSAVVNDLAACGLITIDRPVVGAIIEILSSPGRARPTIIAVRASAGSGASTTVRLLARAARLRGFIPWGLHVDDTVWSEALAGRTLCLFDRQGGRRVWTPLLAHVLRSAKPHVLLSVGSRPIPWGWILQLEPASSAAIAGAITPSLVSPALRREIDKASRRACGLPARFVETIWPSNAPHRRRSVSPSFAAEQPATYGEEGPEAPRSRPRLRSWPVPGDVGVHRQKLGEAIRLLHDGRRAPAERALRALVGSLVRRHDWQHAARGQLALACSLLGRGRPREACGLLDDARTYAVRGEDDPQLVRISIASGHARLDEGRLDEAEVTLHAALGAARAAGEPTLIADAGAAFVRCLFWRGRYPEAQTVLETIDRAQASGRQVVIAVLRSRIAIGCGDISQSMAHATSALGCIDQIASRQQTAAAWYAMAFAHLAAGDMRAVHGDVEKCVAASRAAHDPLRAFKARLIAAEADRRCGSNLAARQLTARARALPLPVTVRVRVSLLADLANGAGSESVRKSTLATGLEALALFAPTPAQERLAGAFDTALDVLQLCQAAGGEAEMLVEICRRIRARLQAAGVALFVADGATLSPIAADGGRVEAALAARVVDVRQAIPPSQYQERIEGGAPVKFGGETIGALTARWTIAAAPDAPRAQMVLTMAATAAGAAVAAAVARRRATAAAGVGELLGISAAIGDVRAAVERAAAAPFGVLIEGESGSGKELVARAVHRRSGRRDRAFCTLNCAALPDDLLDAELFGHSRGAFTGALSERAGVFEDAHLGTLFLDEIGELSPRAQAKLLRTLQEGEVRRVGENAARRVDVRLVAATNRDLRQEAAANRFRFDLLYRLDVIRVTVPPLRERREDIAVLADHYWRIAAERVGSRAMLAPATLAALTNYDWPGNVRELQNVLAALAVRSPKRGIVPPTALPPSFCVPRPDQTWRLGDARRTFEERFIRAALARSGGHRSRAAAELGVSRQGLAKLMLRLRIE